MKMRQDRIIALLVLFVSLFNIHVSAYANEMDKGDEIPQIVSDINSYINVNDDGTLTRENCITGIMWVIGLDKNEADISANTAYFVPVFSDRIYNEKCKGYIIEAVSAGIMKGVTDTPSPLVLPVEKATLKECITFMLRCLKGVDCNTWNDNTISMAVDTGLFTEEEAEYVNPEQYLTIDIYNTMLSRMLDMNRYLYYRPRKLDSGSGVRQRIEIDKNGSMKYIDWIREIIF